MNRQIVIVGASGHGKVIADIAEKNGYSSISFLDDDDSITKCGKYCVVGKSTDAMRYRDCDFIVGIGNSDVRNRIQNDLIAKGFNVVTLIHPKAVVATDVNIGIGTVVMAGGIINSGTAIGDGCIINTSASVDHDCIISDYVHVSVGSHVAGNVTIGKSTWLGIGAVVSNNVGVCENCIIGAGAVVIKDIVCSGTYIGVPAKQKG